MHKFFLLLFFSVYLLSCGNNDDIIHRGKNSFIFKNTQSKSAPEIKVWTYKPTRYSGNSKILFVMHGNKRNGDVYRDQWSDIAEKNNVLLIVPEFSRKYFPKDDNYNMGNMFKMDSTENLLTKNPKNEWSYSVIEPLFDYVKSITGNTSQNYSIYGHSAGSQFVHRFLFFIPEARIYKAVCANAGWYTFPDTLQIFPYGLKGTNATLEDIRDTFSKSVTVLLGTADTITTSASLRRTPEAMLQGKYRFERGQNFYKFCMSKAEEMNVKFNWQLQFAPNVGHKNNQMKIYAEKFLF